MKARNKRDTDRRVGSLNGWQGATRAIAQMGTEEPAGTGSEDTTTEERTQLDLSHESADRGISNGMRGTCPDSSDGKAQSHLGWLIWGSGNVRFTTVGEISCHLRLS